MANEVWLDTLLAPGLWLGVAVAVACSVAWYGWLGGGFTQLLRDLLAGLLGFGAGQMGGNFFGSNLLRMGDVQLLTGMVGAIVALWAGRWLVRLRPTNR